jgi:hypothetical protein
MGESQKGRFSVHWSVHIVFLHYYFLISAFLMLISICLGFSLHSGLEYSLLEILLYEGCRQL